MKKWGKNRQKFGIMTKFLDSTFYLILNHCRGHEENLACLDLVDSVERMDSLEVLDLMDNLDLLDREENLDHLDLQDLLV